MKFNENSLIFNDLHWFCLIFIDFHWFPPILDGAVAVHVARTAGGHAWGDRRDRESSPASRRDTADTVEVGTRGRAKNETWM